jgi:hypothetical protein
LEEVRFGKEAGEGLRCVKDPPTVDTVTGEAAWPGGESGDFDL